MQEGSAAFQRETEDAMQKLITIGFEVVIITLICVSVLSGQPAFNANPATTAPATLVGR
jgi:hypothetical protein